MSEEAVKEKEVKETNEQDWDKTKQELDQERANAKKAKEEALQAKAEADLYREQLASVQTKLEEKEQSLIDRQQQAKDELDRLDPDLVDRSVIANINKLHAELVKTQKQLSANEKKIAQYEQKEAQTVAEQQRQEAVNSILDKCDKEFNPKYRNKALELADTLVDSGKEKRPTDRLEGYFLMKKCYQQLADEEASKAKETTAPPLDSGNGGIGFNDDSLKTGSLGDILADMKKTGDWKRR